MIRWILVDVLSCHIQPTHASAVIALNRVDSTVDRIVGDGASVLAVSQADVTRFTPGGTPGVADLPVATSGGINTDGLDTVVNGGTAERHDATSVGVPGTGIQANRERTSRLNIGSHVGLARDLGVGTDLDNTLGWRSTGAGSAVVGGVWVVGVEVDGSALGIGETSLSPSTTATLSDRSALGDLLRRQNPGLAQETHGIGFDLLSGGESPARTAVALILDRGGQDTGPVNKTSGSVDLADSGVDFNIIGLEDFIATQHLGLELRLRQVRELGDTVDGRSTSLSLHLVTSISKLQVIKEDSEASLLFISRGVRLVMVSLEVLPHFHLEVIVLTVEAAEAVAARERAIKVL